jgi:hypothetical protein
MHDTDRSLSDRLMSQSAVPSRWPAAVRTN